MLQKTIVATLFIVAMALPCRAQTLLAGWETIGVNTAVATLAASYSAPQVVTNL